MTTKVPDPILADLDALHRRAAQDPTVATSLTRINRVGTVISLLKRAGRDCTPAQLRSLQALMAPDVIGHPDQPDTVLGRAVTGAYRTSAPYGRPLTTATQRHLMDGLAEVNRIAGHPPYWWQERGKKPWTKHTRTPLDQTGHTVLRRALGDPASHPRWEPFRLRNLLAVELLWATGSTCEGLAAADTTDLADDHRAITLTINLPGRTEAWTETFPLSENVRAALGLWLPVRRAVIQEHLSAGADAAANQALLITLHPTTADLPEGSRLIPPGMRITRRGLELSYATWSRRLNAQHRGQQGWPVPTTLQGLGRGGAIARGTEPATGQRALTNEDAADIHRRLDQGETLTAVAASLGVSRPTVYAALRRAEQQEKGL
ncbi:helix-turn-helix domain-containing protein [Kitasatospora sp. NPDC052868]|uniref:helix-turn-helix domain-containing protein n=1 Tax=Kitasatospora sp. NPDC052868 TaxID=3364060 RepID=UPI0037C9376C